MSVCFTFCTYPDVSRVLIAALIPIPIKLQITTALSAMTHDESKMTYVENEEVIE